MVVKYKNARLLRIQWIISELYYLIVLILLGQLRGEKEREKRRRQKPRGNRKERLDHKDRMRMSHCLNTSRKM